MKKLLAILFTFSFAFSNTKIDVNLNDLSVMELIKITSKTLNKNIHFSSKIEGKVNFISYEPIRKDNLLNILKLSLSDYGYEIKNHGEILKISKIKEDKNINILEEKPKEEKKEKASKTIFLEYSDVSEIEEVLNSLNLYSKKKLKIASDKNNNLLVLYGEKNVIKRVESIIKSLDIPKGQVFVKALIIEIDDNLLDEVGIKYGILGREVHSGNIFTFSSSLNGGSAIPINTSLINLDLPNITSSISLGASINLLNKTYALDIISQPSILCINNKESLIYVGETVSIQTSNTLTDGGNVVNSFERENIGLSLKVKPRISNNKVLLDINAILEGIKSFDSLSLNPNTNKKEIKTSAIVNNGESVILGGLLETRSEKTVEKIPLAGDIPLIGELFKNRLNENKSRNLVIVITPYIVPKAKDLSYIRDELAKLKILEDDYLKKVLEKLRKSKEKEEDKSEVVSNENLQHQKFVNQYFKQ